MSMNMVHEKIVLDNNETNEALGVAGREARVEHSWFGGEMAPDTVLVHPIVPGYSGTGKHRANGRMPTPGHGTAPVSVKITRFPETDE